MFERGGVAAITGAGSGFGLEAARRCCLAGMKVRPILAATDRDTAVPHVLLLE